MRTFHRLLLATLLLGSGAVNPAFAQEDDAPSAAELQRAKQLYSNGRDLFAEGLYREAIDAWREGHRLSRKPAFLHNMGLAYEQLGFLEEAVDSLNRYRAYARAEEVDELKERIATLEARIASIDAGDGDPGADGIERPKPGIEMLDDDEFEVVRGGRTDNMKPERTKGEGQPLPTQSLALMGGGGTAVLVGLGLGSAALGAKRRAALNCGDATGTTVCLDTAAGDLSTGRSLSVMADVLVIGGLAAAGTGAFLAFGPSKTTTVALSPNQVTVNCAF